MFHTKVKKAFDTMSHDICLICMENACNNINMDDSKFNDSPDKSNQNSITNGAHKVLSVLCDASSGYHNIIVYSD